jgi:hypothetical protein
MNRFEATIVTLAAFALAAVHAPAFGQYVKFDGKDSEGTTKQIQADTKGGKSSKTSSSRKSKEPEKPKEPTFLATGEFESTKEKARESAIQAALEKLHEHLQQQNPPIHRMPTSEMVRKMLLNDQEKVLEEPVDGGTMYKMTVAVRVEPEHVREVRSRERSSEALWVLAGLAGLGAVLAVFFRIDSWTKGYLTSWLVLGTIGAGAMLAGMWWMAK